MGFNSGLKGLSFLCFVVICTFLAFSWGQNPYLGHDAFLAVSVFLPYWTPHLSCGCIAYIIVEKTKQMLLY